jgi:hypothetical protein
MTFFVFVVFNAFVLRNNDVQRPWQIIQSLLVRVILSFFLLFSFRCCDNIFGPIWLFSRIHINFRISALIWHYFIFRAPKDLEYITKTNVSRSFGLPYMSSTSHADPGASYGGAPLFSLLPFFKSNYTMQLQCLWRVSGRRYVKKHFSVTNPTSAWSYACVACSGTNSSADYEEHVWIKTNLSGILLLLSFTLLTYVVV